VRRSLILGFLLAAHSAVAEPAVVNPATYPSPSGLYVLAVDPSHLHGEGAATYRLTRHGKEIWSGERPFTLLDAGVGEDGVVVGYTCSNGTVRRTILHLVILDSRGNVRLDDTPFPQPLADRSPPDVTGLLIDPENDRVVFRISHVAAFEVWKPYQLSTGKPAPAFQPQALMAESESSQPVSKLGLSFGEAQPVRGTPLTLVYWSRDTDWEKRERAARFTLIDPTGKPVWMLNLPEESSDAARERKAWYSHSSGRVILDVSRPREFDIQDGGASERVSFRVETDDTGGWKVSEAERQPYVHVTPVKDMDAFEAVPEKPLRYLGAIELETRRPMIRNVHSFDIDDQGRFGVVSGYGCELSFVIAGLEELSPHEIKLGSLGPGTCESPLVAWAGGSTWLVAAQSEGSAGSWVDTETGVLRPLRLPTGVSVVAAAGKPGGGIVLLGEQQTAAASGDETRAVLLSMGALGDLDKGFSEAAQKAASELQGPTDVAVTSAGLVMVVDAVQGAVVVFDEKGSLQSTIELEKAWGREPSYASGITADADGGFIVEDLGGAVPYVRMLADGRVR
jgi:hypothetical protein